MENKGNFKDLEEGPWFHGTDITPDIILNDGLQMGQADGITGFGVYCTIDLAIAEKYGKYVYKIKQFDCEYKRDSCFDEPVAILKSHVSSELIELYETH